MEGDRSLLAPAPCQQERQKSSAQLRRDESPSPAVRIPSLWSVRRHDGSGERKGKWLLRLSRCHTGGLHQQAPRFSEDYREGNPGGGDGTAVGSGISAV